MNFGLHAGGSTARLLRTLLLWTLLAVLPLLPGTVHAGALDEIIDAGVVRIAVPKDLPPFGAVNEQGRLEGYDIDVANLVARDLGVSLELIPVTSIDRIPFLITRKADLVIANLGITPERARTIGFSTPYAPFFSGVFGGPELSVTSPADLQGKKVAVTRDTIEDRELTRIAPQGTEIVRFDDNGATLSAFFSGSVDLVATGNVVIAMQLKQHPQRQAASKIRLADSPPGIGMRHGEPELQHWVNVFIFHKKLTGDLDRLSRQWLGEPLPPLPVL
jgi:polar amino acid transport system substrate-binding protein